MAAELKFVIGAIDNASATLGKIGKETEKLGGATAKLNAASRLLGAGAIVAFGAASVKAYADAEAQQSKLTQAYQRFPAIASVNISALRAYNDELEKKTATDADSIAAAQAQLAAFQLNGQQIQSLTPLLVDFAQATGRDVTDAAGTLGKALMGNGRALKELGIDFKATGDRSADLATLMELLQGKVGGAGEAFRATTAGSLKELQLQFGNLQEEVGSKLAPTLSALIDKVLPLVEAFGKLPEPLKSTAVAVGAVTAATLLLGPRLLNMAASLRMIFPAAGQAAAGLTAEAAAAGTAATATDAAAVSTKGFLASLAPIAGAAAAAVGVVIALGEAHKFLQDQLGNGAKSAEQWSQATAITGADMAKLRLDMQQVAGQSGTLAAAIKYLGSGDVIGAWTAMRTGGENVANFDSAMAALVASGNVDQAAALVGALGLSTDEARSKLPEYAKALDAAAASTDVMSTATLTTSETVDTFTIKAIDAKTATDNLKAALDELGGKSISLDAATSNLFEALQKGIASMGGLTHATNEARTELNLHSADGRTAQASLQAIAKAADDLATAQAAAGVSSDKIKEKQEQARAAFVRAAVAAGLTADAAEALADKYGLIPDEVTTRVTANTSDATNNIDKVIRQVNSLDGRSVTVTINGVTRNLPNLTNGRATGGYITGPGTSTSDSIPAMLSNGEYVIRADAVSRAGLGLLNDLNDDGVINRARFGGGGFASPAAGLAALQRDTAALVAAQQQLAQLRTSRAERVGSYASLSNSFSFGGSGNAQAELLAANEAVNMARTPAERVAALARLDQAKAAARDAAPTAGNLLKGLKAKLGDIKSFYASLKELRRRGLPLSLLGQVVEAGPLEGGQMAKALLSASPKDFAEIISTQGQIERFSRASAEYDPLVIRQRGVVTTAVNRARRDATYVSSVRLDLDGRQVAAALLAYKKAMGGRDLGLS